MRTDPRLHPVERLKLFDGISESKFFFQNPLHPSKYTVTPHSSSPRTPLRCWVDCHTANDAVVHSTAPPRTRGQATGRFSTLASNAPRNKAPKPANNCRNSIRLTTAQEGIQTHTGEFTVNRKPTFSILPIRRRKNWPQDFRAEQFFFLPQYHEKKALRVFLCGRGAD